MTIHLGDVPASSTLYIPFTTYDANGASVTLSGLAVTDIEIYKNGSVTQRASDNGYALLDTDGIDFDGITGLHGFSVDLSDNSDSGFYAVGSFYWVVVSTVTISSQTVTLLAATFRIRAAESVTGKPKVDVDAFGGTAGTFASGRPEVNTSHIAGSAVSTSSAQIGVNVVNAGGTAWASGSLTSGVFAAGAITASAIAADAIGASELAADAASEIAAAVWDLDATAHQTQGTFGQAIGDPGADTDTIWALVNTNLNATVSSRASQTSVDTIDDFVDTEVAAIKAKTDQLTFTVAGNVDATVTGFTGNAITSAALDPSAGTEIAQAVALNLFTYDTTKTFADAVAGSVVKETADNAGGSSLTEAGIAAAVWDEDATGHQTQGSFGQVLGDSGADTDSVWSLTNTNLDAKISTRASQTSVDTIDDFVDTEVAAIKAKTDQLTFTTANQVDATAVTVSDKTGYRLSATGVDDVLDEVVEGTTTFRQMLRGFASALLSKLSGAGSGTEVFRDIGDSKDRITATVDSSGNRTAITTDLT